MADEPGKINGVWESEALRSEQDAGLGSVRDKVKAHRESVEEFRAKQQADPEGGVEVKAAPRPDPLIALAQAAEAARALPTERREAHTLPQTTDARKDIPLASGVLDYFPAALAEVAKVSKAGNDKHNPGEPLHWARGKSMDQADCIARHLLERGSIDPETGQLHSAQMAWRALALLQLELEEMGAPRARGAR